jgi:uncharacterized membrane protein (Fun14 family)
MSQPEPKAPRAPLPRWKKLAIGVAAIVLVAGVGLKVHGMSQRKTAVRTSSTAPGGPAGSQGLVSNPGTSGGGGTATTVEEPPGAGEKASPFLMGGGFGFFAGLAVGTVLRIFYKIALIVMGVAVLGLGGLSYSGVIGPVNWKSIQDTMDSGVTKVEEKAQGIGNSLLVGIPSAGLFGAGVVAGFKRK